MFVGLHRRRDARRPLIHRVYPDDSPPSYSRTCDATIVTATIVPANWAVQTKLNVPAC
jgi:hypothetical protein